MSRALAAAERVSRGSSSSGRRPPSRRAASMRHRIACTRLAAEPPTASAPAQAADEGMGSADPGTDATPSSRPSTASATMAPLIVGTKRIQTGVPERLAKYVLVVRPPGRAVITLTDQAHLPGRRLRRRRDVYAARAQ